MKRFRGIIDCGLKIYEWGNSEPLPARGGVMGEERMVLGVTFFNGEFYEVGRFLQIQFDHDISSMTLYGMDANR